MEPAFVSVIEAAAFLNLPRSTVYELIAKDEFPVATVRMGRRVLVNREGLYALAKAS